MNSRNRIAEWYNNQTEGYWPENDFDINLSITTWLDKNWFICWGTSALYLILIYLGRRVMDSRTRFGLNQTLALWSGSLALFSILGSYRMALNIYYTLRHDGFDASVCKVDWTYVPVLQFWTTLFALSKIVELGDTAFIVLRKTPLIFLHYYHHVTVFIYTWYSYQARASSGRWYIAMNYSVHSVMYTYYAMSALKFRAPQWVRMGITLFQLSQMVVGVIVNIYAKTVKNAGRHCDITEDNIFYSLLMYASYFMLFLKFFYDAYFQSKKATTKATLNQTMKSHTNGYSVSENGHTKMNGNGHYENGVANGVTNGYIANGDSKKTE